MIEPITGLGPKCIGFRASGRVTREDYQEHVIPVLDKALMDNRKVRVIYQLGPDFEGMKPGAVLDDALVTLRHLKTFERVAIVTDVDWLAKAAAFFAFTLPYPIQIFKNDQLNHAKDWVEGLAPA